jgi:hypothetical protein
MRKIIMLIVILAAGMSLAAQTPGRAQFDFFGGQSFNGPRAGMTFANKGPALAISGAARGVEGYLVSSEDDLEFSGRQRLIIAVSGITENDAFDMAKLLKLELNGEPQITLTPGMKNRNDRDYINARNGEAVFDLTGLENIRRISLVFFNCAVADLKIAVFYE